MQFERIKIGDVVKHFKRESLGSDATENAYLYEVLNFAIDSETGHPLVVYKALYAPFRVYVRELTDFMGTVDKIKYPNVKQVYRFEPIDSL